MQGLYTDDPITGSFDDRLNRQPFAAQVARVCRTAAKHSDSAVISLVGAWGSGKSSVLTLVAEELSQDEDWIVKQFNPWAFSNIDSLLLRFFETLTADLPGSLGEKARQRIAEYAEKISPVAALGAPFGLDLGRVADGTASILRGDSSTFGRFKAAEKSLKDLQCRILIVIDDLDRLHPEELLMVFKLVRLVGRLPNVHYLLSYDDKTLTDALVRTELALNNPRRAQDYVEKMVQVRLDLPILNRRQLANLSSQALDQVFSNHHLELEEPETQEVAQLYRTYLNKRLTSPRAIKRYFTQVDALLDLVSDEVNFPDFLMLTYLRIFYPPAYQLLPSKRDELVGSFRAALQNRKLGEVERRERWTEALGALLPTEEVEEVYQILESLFPRIAGSDRAAKDEGRSRRVSSETYFDRYFMFGVPEDDIADRAVAAGILSVENADALSKERRLLETRLVSDPALVLDKIRLMHERSDIQQPAAVAQFLAAYYGRLRDEENFLVLPPDLRIIHSLRTLFDSMGREARLQCVSEIVAAGHDVPLIHLADILLQEPDQDERPYWLADLTPIASDCMFRRLTEAASEPVSVVPRDTLMLLHRWPRLRGSETLQHWLWDQVTRGKWNLSDLLTLLVPIAVSSAGTRSIGTLTTKTLDSFFGARRLVREIGDEVLDGSTQSPATLEHRVEPSMENRKLYALAIVRTIRDSLRAEEAI